MQKTEFVENQNSISVVFKEYAVVYIFEEGLCARIIIYTDNELNLNLPENVYIIRRIDSQF